MVHISGKHPIRCSAMLLLCTAFLYAQAPDTLWTKTYGSAGMDIGDCVLATPDGGYIIAGAYNGAGWTDIWILKTDSLGDTVWTKTYGGSDGDRAFCIEATSDNGYVIVGVTISFGAGGGDMWLLKTDSTGDTLWTRTYGGTSYDEGRCVREVGNSGYIIAGWTESFGAGGRDGWVLRTDAMGDSAWAMTYGSTYEDIFHGIVETQDGGYVLVGGSEYYAVGDYDLWLMKIDSSGTSVWTKIYAGTSYLDDMGHCIQMTQDSGYIITGYSEPYSAGMRDVWILKTGASGDTIWTQKLGGADNDYGMWVCETQDGGYIVCGYTSSYGQWGDVWVIRMNASGDTLWTTTYGTASMENGYCIRATQDGGYIISGLTYGEAYDLYLVKTGPETAVSENNGTTPSMLMLASSNPFASVAEIRYSTNNNGRVDMDIYSITGSLVRKLFHGYRVAGEHCLRWDGRDGLGKELPTGIYIITLRTETELATSKLVLIK